MLPDKRLSVTFPATTVLDTGTQEAVYIDNKIITCTVVASSAEKVTLADCQGDNLALFVEGAEARMHLN